MNKIYINLTGATKPDYTTIAGHHAFRLSEQFDIGEINSLYIEDVLDYAPAENFDKWIDEYVGYIAHGGDITIIGNNLDAIGRDITLQIINVTEANSYLYKAIDGYMCVSIHRIADVVEALKARGLQVITRRINGYKYEVTARRN